MLNLIYFSINVDNMFLVNFSGFSNLVSGFSFNFFYFELSFYCLFFIVLSLAKGFKKWALFFQWHNRLMLLIEKFWPLISITVAAILLFYWTLDIEIPVLILVKRFLRFLSFNLFSLYFLKYSSLIFKVLKSRERLINFLCYQQSKKKKVVQIFIRSFKTILVFIVCYIITGHIAIFHYLLLEVGSNCVLFIYGWWRLQDTISTIVKKG